MGLWYLGRIMKPLVFLFFAATLIFNISVRGNQHFSYLANSFLQGKAFFTTIPDTSWTDTSFFRNQHYWPLGPFPAVLLLPFVFVANLPHFFLFQGILNFFLVIGVFAFVYKIAGLKNYSSHDSLLLAFAFCFASAFIGVAFLSISWYFSQVITVFFLLWAIYEFLTKKRYLLLGIIMGIVVATRLTAGLGLIFFVLEIMFSNTGIPRKIRNISFLIIPFFVSLSFLGFYNFLRFENIFETGYRYQIVFNQALEIARNLGVFSWQHVPGNLYRFLLAGPLPVTIKGSPQILKFPFFRTDSWGMSIFVTSPYFVYLFFLNFKDKISKFLIITILVIAIPILFYYGVGFTQLGYRYSLDFLPWLFLLLIKSYRLQTETISFRFKILIIFSAIFNFYLFYTWGSFHYG